MWGKMALFLAGALTGYFGKKIFSNNTPAPAPKTQAATENCSAETKNDKEKKMDTPEAVLITEPAAVAALKHIFENNGPGKLDWDISVAGQVAATDGRLGARDGALISLNLNETDLRGVLKLHDVESLGTLKATWCNLEGIDLKNLPSLTELDLWSNFKISDLSPLAALTALTALTKLDVSFNNISDLSPLAGLTALTKLGVSVNNISDFSPLAGLTALTELSASLQNGDGVSDLSPLANLTSLTELSLSGKKINTLAPLAGLSNLTKFEVYDVVFSDLSLLTGMAKLTELKITSSAISDIGPLARLTNLRKLDLSNCTISDIGPLAGLTSLNALNLKGNEIIDIRPLSGLAKLTELDIGDNMIHDFSPLGDLKKLVSEDSFTKQRNETRAALAASAKKEACAREIGKCPHCKRVIRYPDIEEWETHRSYSIFFKGIPVFTIFHSALPVYEKSGNCPDCGHPITLQGRFYNWRIVTL